MGSMTATATKPTFPPLTLQDRCDRCSAQAWTAWTHAQNSPAEPMKFCNHHTTEHEPALVASGWTLAVDQREQLLASEQGPR